MSALAEAATSYLEIRRALGFKLKEHGRLLSSLVSYLDERGIETLTAQAAVAWACLPTDAGPARWSRRLSVARGFASYMVSIDSATAMPPTRMWPHRHRPEPFVCSPVQIDALVDAAGSFGAPVTATTYQTVIGLLAVTGMRVGEALGLNHDDVDLDAGVLTVRGAKFNKSREVPLHPTTVSALVAYISMRDERFTHRVSTSVFASKRGGPLGASRLWIHWQGTVDRVGLDRGDGRRPRLHDLRHSFAVNTLRTWHERGLDVEARLPLLSTYLGHANPAATYWYLTATPDLLAAAARRLEAALGGGS